MIQFPTTRPPRADSFKRWLGATVERRFDVTPLLFESGIQKVADQPMIPRRCPISLRLYLVPDLWRYVGEESKLASFRISERRNTREKVEAMRVWWRRGEEALKCCNVDCGSESSPVCWGQVTRMFEGHRLSVAPNGSRLSCGRNARGRKEAERQIKRLGGEATQFLPTCERPAASSAC